MVHGRHIAVLCLRVIAAAIHPVHGHIGGASMIYRGELGFVPAGCLLVGDLFAGSLNMGFPHGYLLLRGGSCGDTARTAIKACPIVDDGCIADHGAINIGVVDHCPVYIHHGGIITEMSAGPYSSAKSDASIAVAIIYASIKADMGTPVTD